MIFFITSESSYEIPPPQTVDLEDRLNKYFEFKSYGQQLNKISSIVICVSEKFDFLHPVRSPKILKGKTVLEVEYKLNFEKYKSMDSDEQKKYISSEFYMNLKGVFDAKKIKEFDSESFLRDLDFFFKGS